VSQQTESRSALSLGNPVGVCVLDPGVDGNFQFIPRALRKQSDWTRRGRGRHCRSFLPLWTGPYAGLLRSWNCVSGPSLFPQTLATVGFFGLRYLLQRIDHPFRRILLLVHLLRNEAVIRSKSRLSQWGPPCAPVVHAFSPRLIRFFNSAHQLAQPPNLLPESKVVVILEQVVGT